MREETETDARSPPWVADGVALRICGSGRRNHSDDSLTADLLVSSVLWFAKIKVVVIRLHEGNASPFLLLFVKLQVMDNKAIAASVKKRAELVIYVCKHVFTPMYDTLQCTLSQEQVLLP